MVRAALQLSDSNYSRIKRKIAKNNLVINSNFYYSQKRKENFMRRILFLFLLLCATTEVFAARCPDVDEPLCPTTICPSGLFMGDDGKCYDCNTDKSVSVRCIGWKEAFKICPNRFRFGDSCGIESELSCECFQGKKKNSTILNMLERVFANQITYMVEDEGGWKSRCVVDLESHVCYYPDRLY